MFSTHLFRNELLLWAVALVLILPGCQLPNSAPATAGPANESSNHTRAGDLANHLAHSADIAKTRSLREAKSPTRLRFPVKPAQDRTLLSPPTTDDITDTNEISATIPQDETRRRPGPSGVTTLAAHLKENNVRTNAQVALSSQNLQATGFGHAESTQDVTRLSDSAIRDSQARPLNPRTDAENGRSPDGVAQKNCGLNVADKSGELKPVELVSDELSLPPEPAGFLQIPPQPLDGNAAYEQAPSQLPESDTATVEFPIDLPTALRLAGADNWNIRLATERVREAQARYDAARVLWLPSLNAGVGYTKHEGQIQDTRGEVIDVSRNSLFAGGGAALGSAPLAGGSGGPARLQVDLSLADALFEPLAACQLVRAAHASESVTFNDTLLGVALAYYDLVDAQGRLAVARQNLENANEVLNLTEGFVAAGKGSRADTARARVEATLRQQTTIDARMRIEVASAELARLIQLDPDRLDPRTLLVALDATPLPVELVPESAELSILIERGLCCRPEMAETQALVEAGRHRARAERWRPLIPNVHVGVSAGGFGGGENDELHQLDGRGDFDVLAVWQLKNLGYGTHAAIQERSSHYRQRLLGNYQVRDLIATEVKSAYHQVHAQRRQLQLAESNVQQAEESYRQNITRIRALEGLPLEAIQALQAVGTARSAYLAATIEYNRAQARLLRAIGQPVSQ